MRSSYIVYKRDLTDDNDRGVKLGIILQTTKGLKIEFSDDFKHRLKEYDPAYDRLILDSLPDTLVSISRQRTFSISSFKGGSVRTSSPDFLDELRQIYRSNIQITEPKALKVNNRNLSSTLDKKLARI